MTQSAPVRSKKWLWISLVAIFVGVGALVLVFSSRFGVDPRLVNSPLIGEPVPPLALQVLEQGELPGVQTGDGVFEDALADLRGDVLIINFWASWCFPCRGEHPALTSVAQDYADRGVSLVGVIYQDEPEDAAGFLDELGWGGDNYRYVLDPKSRGAVEYGVFGVPETYFVDSAGIIVGKIQGAVTSSAVRSVLEQILAGESPAI
ncbi:MAG: redoxin domain-containing protein [Acidimicrobiia bacterium]|nr:redoxin domain-containing protein [Acidimicrobiia bacterium]